MRVVKVDKEIIKKLRESRLSTEMKSLENCDFLIIIEREEKIIAASGIGGLFHVPSLQIHYDFRKRALGGKLLKETIEESKRRRYSFIAGSRNPENLEAVRLHDFFEFHTIFQVKYAPNFTRDVVIKTFNRKGKIVSKFLRIFNTLAGTIVLACILRIIKPFFSNILTLTPEEFPNPNIIYMIKNFKKLKNG